MGIKCPDCQSDDVYMMSMPDSRDIMAFQCGTCGIDFTTSPERPKTMREVTQETGPQFAPGSRITCPICKRSVRIRKDRRVAIHNMRRTWGHGPYCPASGKSRPDLPDPPEQTPTRPAPAPIPGF